MLWDIGCSWVVNILTLLFNYLPFTFSVKAADLSELLKMIDQAFFIFPVDIFIEAMLLFIFWTTVHFVWAIIEWVYKKIPGVE